MLTLLGATLAASVRMTRAGMIQALRSDFAEMARLNGFPERRVVWRHALRNALAPAVQIFAQNLQYLIGGVIVVEYLFAYPGLGKELVDSVAIRDVRAVQSIALLIAVAVVALNMIADLLVSCSCRSCGRPRGETGSVSRARPRARSAWRCWRSSCWSRSVGPYFAAPPARADDRPAVRGPGNGVPLGTDGLGRDALARTLWGGRSVLALAGLATLLAYIVGGAIGLIAGYLQRLGRRRADARRGRARGCAGAALHPRAPDRCGHRQRHARRGGRDRAGAR